MLHIGKYFHYIFRGAYKILFYPFMARKYIKHKDDYSLKERYDYVRAKTDIVLLGMMQLKFEVKGLEKLSDNETYLFTPNHQGDLDPLVLINILSKPSVFVSKKEIAKFPIIGKFDYMLDAFFYDRKNPRDALNMMNYCVGYLDKGTNVTIFPEGTRSKDKDILIHEYKPGAFKCAYKSKVKIVPVVIDKAYLPLSIKKKNTDKVIKISFLDPIEYDTYKDLPTVELAKMVEDLAKIELNNMRNN